MCAHGRYICKNSSGAAFFAASLLFAVRDMLDDILDGTVENIAQSIEYHGLDDPVISKPLELSFVYSIVLYEFVLADVFSLHRTPQRGIAYQFHHLACILD